MNIKKAEVIVEKVHKIITQWMAFVERQKVPDDLAKAIKTTLLV